jgi:peptidoglycan/LPS O-acetylase OafA/YrhL
MSGGKQRLPEFEALRALSIILLMALHSDIFSKQVYGFEFGPISHFVGAFLLGSFFFLAGYFQEASMQKHVDTFSYFKSKFIRIFPPYWLALAMFTVVMGYSLKRLDLAVYLLGAQFIFSPAYVKPLLTLWYLSVVMGYYILFWFLAKWIKPGLWLGLWSAVFFFAAYGLHKLTGLFDGRFFEYYFIFLAGLYFARFQQAREFLFNLNFMAHV